MVLQIEVDPVTKARLSAEAELRGLAVEAYASSLLRGSASELPADTAMPTLESFQQMLAEMAKGAENRPILPPEAFERESFYEDGR